MEISGYDGKQVKVTDIYGDIHTGPAAFYNAGHCLREYGAEEAALAVEGAFLFESQIL